MKPRLETNRGNQASKQQQDDSGQRQGQSSADYISSATPAPWQSATRQDLEHEVNGEEREAKTRIGGQHNFGHVQNPLQEVDCHVTTSSHPETDPIDELQSLSPAVLRVNRVGAKQSLERALRFGHGSGVRPAVGDSGAVEMMGNSFNWAVAASLYVELSRSEEREYVVSDQFLHSDTKG